MEQAKTVFVQNGNEYARFFIWEETAIQTGGKTVYGAVWTAYSSFGTFGHYWCSMGMPFNEFIKNLDKHYLLSKIGKREDDYSTFAENVKNDVNYLYENREVNWTKKEYKEIIEEIENYSRDLYGDDLYKAISEIYEIEDEIEFCELLDQTFDSQSTGFVEKLWPEFVRIYNESTR
jgi:hypothetical protein